MHAIGTWNLRNHEKGTSSDAETAAMWTEKKAAMECTTLQYQSNPLLFVRLLDSKFGIPCGTSQRYVGGPWTLEMRTCVPLRHTIP